MLSFRYAILIAASLSTAAFCQDPPPAPPPAAGNMIYVQKGVMPAGAITAVAPDMGFFRAEFGGPTSTVKGSPYSAQAVTEFTQTLTDGNRIHRTSTSPLARDSDGRTRREESLVAIGPWANSGDAPKTVFINDPVAGVNYVLDANSKTANVMHNVMRESPGALAQKIQIMDGAGPGIAGAIRINAGASASAAAVPEMKRESLGSQMIEGVMADGTRMSRTIPAGQIGNDQPINVVTETWYSQELQTTVMTKTSDPRTGETVYRLTNINRAEPDPALFSVPSGYTVNEGKQVRIINGAVNSDPGTGNQQ